MVRRTDACYDRGFHLSCEMVSERRGSFTQNRRKIRPLNFSMILVVYLSREIFHSSGIISVYFFLPKSVFRRGLKLPDRGVVLRKKVVHLYHRSTRRVTIHTKTYIFHYLYDPNLALITALPRIVVKNASSTLSLESPASFFAALSTRPRSG